MRIRRPWIVAAFMLLALTGWSHERWRQQLTEMLERMRTGQFVEEASRSQTFLLNDDRWLEFDIPLHGTIVRVLTNSGVEEIPEQVASLGEERPG